MIKAVSNDGVNWPAVGDSASFLDSADTPMLINNTKRIGDVGGLTMPNGDIYLYTNYSGTNPTGPSLNIVRFTLQNPIGIFGNNQPDQHLITFPNPAVSLIYLDFAGMNLSPNEMINVEVMNLFGHKVLSSTVMINSSNQIVLNIESLAKGVYFVKSSTTKYAFLNKIVVN